MKCALISLLLGVALALAVTACSSTYNRQARYGTTERSPEYYHLYGPGAEEPPDYGTDGE